MATTTPGLDLKWRWRVYPNEAGNRTAVVQKSDLWGWEVFLRLNGNYVSYGDKRFDFKFNATRCARRWVKHGEIKVLIEIPRDREVERYSQ